MTTARPDNEAFAQEETRRDALRHKIRIQFVCVMFVALFTLSVEASLLRGTVVKVSDGDTIQVVDGSGAKHKVRLAKIDAPELKQKWGKEATVRLKEFIHEKVVRVKWDEKDRYSRILGVVYLGRRDINLSMVRTGNAWHYKHFDNTRSYSVAEQRARKKRLGLWSHPHPVNPQEWRRQHKHRRQNKN